MDSANSIDSDSDVEFEGELEQHATEEVIPAKSFKRYTMIYNQFQKWKASSDTTSNAEAVLMAYFEELAKTKKPPSLYSCYSMLKTTMKINDNIDIALYHTLSTYLREKAAGYKSTKAKIFTKDEIERFINEAPDELWLDVKVPNILNENKIWFVFLWFVHCLQVVCIFGICGACQTHVLPQINVQHVKMYHDMCLVTLPNTKTKVPQSFTITGTYFSVVKKYADMRPYHVMCDNFFLNYRHGKCTVQTVGKNKIFKMPQRIATYLKLPEPERYTGNLNKDGLRIPFC